MAIDFSNPCAAATALREVLNRAMAEGRAQQIEYTSGNGVGRKLTKEFVSIADLRAHISRLDGECKTLTTGRPSRFAVRAGGHI